MILHGTKDEWTPEFLQLSYDIEKEIASMKEENLFEIAPQWARLTLKMLEGYPVFHTHALKKAMEICQKETGECEWPKISEEYMERGVTEYLEQLQLLSKLCDMVKTGTKEKEVEKAPSKKMQAFQRILKMNEELHLCSDGTKFTREELHERH